MKKAPSRSSSNMRPRLNKRRSYFLALGLIFILFSLLVGCKADEQLDDTVKTELQQILALQADINNYQFQGSADLQIDATQFISGDNPLTASFVSNLLNSTITWHGTVQSDPEQLEMDLVIAPQGLATTIEIPIIIKDSKLYFRIPLIQADETEHFIVELNEETLQQGSSLWSDTAYSILNAISPQWYERLDQQSTIRISLTEDNHSEIFTSFFEILPAIIEQWEDSRLLSVEQSTELQNSISVAAEEFIQSIVIDEPGQLSITWNDQNYITLYSLQLFISNHAIDIHHTIKNVNEAPSFVKEIPTEDVLRPFQDIFTIE